MSRRIFVVWFVALSATFVPVLFWAGIFSSIVPTFCIFLSMFGHRVKAITWWQLAHVLVYLSIFAGFALAVFRVASFIPGQVLRQSLLVLILLLPVLSSFARVLTYSSIQGGGGTYNFWTAVERYFEKRR
jgi:hypothetical protein